MITKITHLTLFVLDQDKTLEFYTKIGFKVHTDANFGDLRWLTLNLIEQPEFELVLMAATNDEEKKLVGKQGASKPFFTIQTDDCQKDFERLKSEGVKFLHEPINEPWGTAAMFVDLYNNMIYMCQPS